MVVAGFRHLTSRDLDPFLHTHCVLANMTRNAAGEWRSVEPTRIRWNAKLIGAVYRNELARRLEALGMAIAPRLVGRIPGFELAGYSRAFVEAFSGRSAEIEAYLERHDLPRTAKNTQKAALRTRKPKRDKSVADLVPAWRARARRLGLMREKAVLSPPRPLDPLTGGGGAPCRACRHPICRRTSCASGNARPPCRSCRAVRTWCRAARGNGAPSPLPGAGGTVPRAGTGAAGGGRAGGGACRGTAGTDPGSRDTGGGARSRARGATRWPRSTRRSRGRCAAAS